MSFAKPVLYNVYSYLLLSFIAFSCDGGVGTGVWAETANVITKQCLCTKLRPSRFQRSITALGSAIHNHMPPIPRLCHKCIILFPACYTVAATPKCYYAPQLV